MASGNMARAHKPVGTGRSGANRYVSSALRTAPTSIFSISSCGTAAQRHCAILRWCSLRLCPVPAARAGPRRAAPRRAHFHRRTACLSRGRARGLQLLPALAHLVVFERIEQVRRLEHVALAGGAACAARRIRPPSRPDPEPRLRLRAAAAWPRQQCRRRKALLTVGLSRASADYI